MDAKSVIYDEIPQSTMDSNDFVGVGAESLASVKERSVATDEFGKKAEDTETQKRCASEVKIPDIVPEPPRIRTSGSNNDLHHIEFMDGGASNNSTPQPNDSMKQSDSSLQVDQTSVGKCIGDTNAIDINWTKSEPWIIADWIKSKVTCKKDDIKSTKEEEIQLMERGENDTLQNTNKSIAISLKEQEEVPELTSIDGYKHQAEYFQWDETDDKEYTEFQDMSIKFLGTENMTHRSMIKTTKPMPWKNFYFETSITSLGSDSVAIGLTTHIPEKRSLRFPGKICKTASLVVQHNHLSMYFGSSIPVEEEYRSVSSSDVLGCKVEMISDDTARYRLCTFTINGNPAGTPRYLEDVELFPSIMINSPGAILDTNFGEKRFYHDPKDSFKGTKSYHHLSVIRGEESDVSENGFTIEFKGTFIGRCTFIRTPIPVPPDIQEYYFETLIARTTEGEPTRVGVGFTTKIPINNDYDYYEIEANAIALMCDTGNILKGNESMFSSNDSVEENDLIGCRLRRVRTGGGLYQIIQFSKNGKDVGYPITDDTCLPLYPSFWIASTGVVVNTNLGQRSIEKDGSQEKAKESKLHTVLRSAWYLISLPILPYFWYKGKLDSWKNPKDPKLLVINYVLSMVLSVIDCVTDFVAGVSYLEKKQRYFGSTTLALPFFPWLCKSFIELTSTIKMAYYHFELFKTLKLTILKSKLKCTLKHLPFVQPLSNLDSIVELASMEESEAESIILKLGSQCNWEPFLEALPQLVLQFYIVLQMISNGRFAEDHSSIVLGSMIMSIVSISMAAGGSYLFERCTHPVPSHLMAKIFFAIFYLVIVGSRALSLATLGLLFNRHKWITVIYLSSSMLVIVGGVKLAELRWPNTMSSIHKWNPKIYYSNDKGIKGEYEEHPQRGFQAFIQETKMKSMFLGFFVPCILISPNFYVFEISAILSTVEHLAGSIAGVSLCFTKNEYCLSIQSNSNGTGNTTTSEDQSNEPNQTLQQMFIINICLLSLSAAGLGLITYLHYLPMLRKWMCGKFNHPSLIALFIEEEAENEYLMEKEAKEHEPKWQNRLSKMRQEQLETREPRVQEFEKLCKSIEHLDGDIIIRRRGNSTIKKTTFQLLKELRWGEDFIGILLTHIHLKNFKQKMLKNNCNDETKSEDIPIYNDDINQFYEQIEKNMDDIDTSNEDGKNGLMVGIKKHNKFAVELLLMNGASIMHTNNDDETAFEVGIDAGNEAINLLLWKYAKDNQEQYELFYELCRKGNLEAVKFCIENSSHPETKQLIEFNKNEKKLFPLLRCLIGRKTDLAKVLISQHKRLNEAFLCVGDVTGYNALMLSSRFGQLDIVELLLPSYIKSEKVTSQNNLGESALDLSADYGYTSIVQILVEHFKKETKIEAQNEDGDTAIDFAIQKNHKDIVDVIKKALEGY